MILCSFPDLLQAIRPWFFEVRNQRQGDSKKWFFLSPYVLYLILYVPEKKSSGRLSHAKKNPLKHAEWDGFCPLAGASNRQAMDASQSPQESGALSRYFQYVQHERLLRK
jgi:hypothetical protein